MRRVAVTFPPIKTAYQFLHTETEFEHVHGPLRGAITTNTVAVRNDERVLVEMPRRLRGHRTVRNVDRARDVFAVKGFRRTRVDDGNVLAGFAGNAKVPRVDLVLKLVGVVLQLIIHGIALLVSCRPTTELTCPGCSGGYRSEQAYMRPGSGAAAGYGSPSVISATGIPCRRSCHPGRRGHRFP